DLGLVRHEEVIEMARQEFRGSRLLHNDVDDVFAIKASRMAQEGLLAVVMVFGLIRKTPVEAAQGQAWEFWADGPAGEGTRGLFDIVLAVVAHPHREQLQQLPAPVFIDGAAM